MPKTTPSDHALQARRLYDFAHIVNGNLTGRDLVEMLTGTFRACPDGVALAIAELSGYALDAADTVDPFSPTTTATTTRAQRKTPAGRQGLGRGSLCKEQVT